MNDKIKITIGRKDTAAIDFLDSIKPFQGEFKTSTPEDIADFSENIKQNGFIRPIRLWDRGKKGIFCIDGEQIIKAVKLLISQGIPIPKIPIEWLSLETEEQAWQLIYAYNSQYGKINPDFDCTAQVKTEYMEIMRLPSFRKPKTAKEIAKQKKEYPFAPGDTLKLGEVEIIIAAPDFSRPGKYMVPTLPLVMKYVKQYADDCKYKNIQPKVRLNGVFMDITKG